MRAPGQLSRAAQCAGRIADEIVYHVVGQGGRRRVEVVGAGLQLRNEPLQRAPPRESVVRWEQQAALAEDDRLPMRVLTGWRCSTRRRRRPRR